jgi:hypothetical protein
MMSNMPPGGGPMGAGGPPVGAPPGSTPTPDQPDQMPASPNDIRRQLSMLLEKARQLAEQNGIDWNSLVAETVKPGSKTPPPQPPGVRPPVPQVPRP